MDIQIGARIHVKSISREHVYLTTVFDIQDSNIIIDMPKREREFVCFPLRKELNLIYPMEDKVIKFCSDVQNIVVIPKDITPKLILSRPRLVEEVPYTRKSERIFADLPVRIMMGDQIRYGKTIDISVNGAQIVTRHELHQGDQVSLEIGLGFHGVITAKSEVKWINQGDNLDHYGISFVHIKPQDLEILGEYVDHMLRLVQSE